MVGKNNLERADFCKKLELSEWDLFGVLKKGLPLRSRQLGEISKDQRGHSSVGLRNS